MNYQDRAKQATTEGRLENIQAAYFGDWKEGDKLIGKYQGRASVDSKSGGKPYYVYAFDTDEGRVETALGASISKGDIDPFMADMVYIITFIGWVQLDKGRRMRDFRIERIVPQGPTHNESF